jgi:hypothetical protein
MTTAFKLGLPIDIPWKRICVTEDMVDRVVCDRVLPPKWHSSIAVFKYRPEDEYQLYPDYDISYLKVSCTITGYQPLEDEIQGQIDWGGLDVTTMEGVTELLSSYFPCTGAILQVVVGPAGRRADQRPLDEYPFFMDFEPKKRELYEMATDTQERQSRSTESLTVGKSAGTARSLEVLDVDMGGSTSFGAQGQYAGTGGGFTYSSSNQGQWGTKSLNTQDSQTARNTEMGTERRETQAFTTQLSQMYHLLDSYHVGTNRAVFFVQPRPHVLEEPTGFVRGPRKVEGIQEFFLVVAAPRNRRDYCVSVRLDTAHLAETDIMDYETRSEVSDMATASAHVPTRNDIPAGTTTRQACFIGCWDVTYHCFRTHSVDDVVYDAPAGFDIIGHVDVVNQTNGHGSTSVSVSPDRKVLTVHAEANGHICFEGSEVCVDCPDEVDKWTGSARRQVQVQLRSTEPTRKVGTRSSLLITTRGLCCCEEKGERERPLITVADLPHDLAVLPIRNSFSLAAGVAGMAEAGGTVLRQQPGGAAPAAEDDCGCGGAGRHSGQGGAGAAPALALASLRRANAISEVVREELTRRVTTSALRPGHESFVDTELFARQLEGIMSRSRRGREQLRERAALPGSVAKVVADRLNRKADGLSRRDLLRVRSDELARESGMSVEEVRRVKLATLGLRLRGRKDDPEKGGGGDDPGSGGKGGARGAKRTAE